MNYEIIEKELKKRIETTYNWGRKQQDAIDSKTNFIYKISSFDIVCDQIDALFKDSLNYNDLKNYALNRWFNFWSAQAIEALFCEHKIVIPHKNPKDKFVDFYINSIPFDHKTTVFPANFKKSMPYAIEHKKELITWLYENQSQQNRKHLKNRLFIVLINAENNEEHWKLKAEINWLKKIISSYLINFSVSKLSKLSIEGQEVVSDIIWAIK